MDSVREPCQVLDDAVPVYPRDKDSGNIPCREKLPERIRGGDPVSLGDSAHIHSMIIGIGPYHVQHLRKQGCRNQYPAPASGSGHTHHHGLGGGSGTVVHGSVGTVHPCKRAYHALELEYIPESTL